MGGSGPSFPMPPSATTPVAPAGSKPADDFEELFGGVNATPRPGPAAPPPPGSPAGAGGGLTATAQFNMPLPSKPAAGGVPGAPPSAPSGVTAPPGVAPAAAVGAGSYTQMMQTPAAPQSLISQQPGAAGKPGAAQKKKGIPPLVFIGVGLVVFIIIVLVLIILMKKPS